MVSNEPENNVPVRDNQSYQPNKSMEHYPPQLQPVQQANSDRQVIELWLHGRSKHTQRAYQKDITDFLEFVDTPLRNITLGQLQGYSDNLHAKQLSPASIKRKTASIKSMFTFAHKIGFLVFDVGKPLKTPYCKVFPVSRSGTGCLLELRERLVGYSPGGIT